MPDEVTLDVTTIEENVTVETTAGDVVEIQVVAPTGPAGATGPAGPNSVTSATTSDGTANLSLSNVSTTTATVSGLLTAGHIHGNLAGTLYTHVRTGEAMSKGDPFYISGFHVGSSQPIAMRADASNAAKMPAVGVMDADYANNTSGANGIISGTLSSIDTDGYAVNSPIYVADGGGYSNTAGTIPQQVGITERANANTGAFIVTNSKVISFADVSDSQTGTATLNLAGATIYPNGSITYASSNSGGAVALSGQLATDFRNVKLPNASGNLALVASTTGQISFADIFDTGAGTADLSIDDLTVNDVTATGFLDLGDFTINAPTGEVIFGSAAIVDFSAGSTINFNSIGYIYGTGAAAEHRTALGLTTLATTTPGTNVANFLEFPTSANLASALTDENGTGGGFVRAEGATLTSPSLVGPVNLTSQDASTADRVMNRGLVDSRTVISKLDSNFTVNSNTSYNATSMVLSLTAGWWEINGEFRIDSAVSAAGAKLYLAFTGLLPEAYLHRIWIASVSSGSASPLLLYNNPTYGTGSQPFLLSQAISSTSGGIFKVGPSLIYLTGDATITVGMSQNTANASNTTMLAFPFSRIWATRLRH